MPGYCLLNRPGLAGRQNSRRIADHGPEDHQEAVLAGTTSTRLLARQPARPGASGPAGRRRASPCRAAPGRPGSRNSSARIVSSGRGGEILKKAPARFAPAALDRPFRQWSASSKNTVGCSGSSRPAACRSPPGPAGPVSSKDRSEGRPAFAGTERHRPLRDRGHQRPRAMANHARRRAGSPPMDRLVRQPPTARPHRLHSAHRGRARPLRQPRNTRPSRLTVEAITPRQSRGGSLAARVPFGSG